MFGDNFFFSPGNTDLSDLYADDKLFYPTTTSSTITITPNTITAIPYYANSGTSGALSAELDILKEEIRKLKMTTPDFTELKCRECGGEIEQKYGDPIVKCPYCKTVYVVGRRMIWES